MPLRREPAEAAHLHRHGADHQQRPAVEQQGLHQVRDHHRTHPSDGGVGHRDEAADDGDDRHPALAHACHDGDRFGGEINHERHPYQSQEQEEAGTQQAHAQAEALLQQFIGALAARAHVDRQQHKTDHGKDQRIGEVVRGKCRPFAQRLTWQGHVRDRAQQRGKEGHADEDRIHLPGADEILARRAVAARAPPAEKNRPCAVEADDHPVDPDQAVAG